MASSTIVSETAKRSQRSPVTRLLMGRDGIFFAVLLITLLAACLFVPRFASATTVGYLLLNAVPALMVALPMTLIIITAEIDLSVASIVGLAAATIGNLTLHGVPFGISVLAALAVGLVAGLVNGFLIAFVGLPSLAVTIGTMALYRGLTLVVIGDNSVSASSQPEGVVDFVGSKLGLTGIPTVMLVVLLFVLIFGVALHFTPGGRGLYALGYSEEAARFVGIKVRWAKFWLYLASGLTCAFVGVYWALYYSIRSDSGMGLELTVIAAVLLGGVSIFGGRGTITGSMMGVLFIAVVNYALRLQRIPDVTLVIITGSLLIVSVVGPSIFAAVRQWLHVRKVQRVFPQATKPEATEA